MTSLATTVREHTVDAGLTNDTTYQVQVRATYTSPAGNSPWVPSSLRVTPQGRARCADLDRWQASTRVRS